MVLQCSVVPSSTKGQSHGQKSSSDERGSHDRQVPLNLQGRLEKPHFHLSGINDGTR